MKPVKRERIAGMGMHYKFRPLDYFLESQQELGVQSVEFWCARPHFLLDDYGFEDVKKLREKLAEYKKSLSDTEIKTLIEKTRELKLYQDTPSPKEELEKIPLLKREDIEEQPEKLCLEVKEIDNTTVLAHNMFTSGIGYLKVLFDTNRVPAEDLPYVGLLKSVLGYVNTRSIPTVILPAKSI